MSAALGATVSHADLLRGWRFLTHHASVLLAVARDPDATVDEIAELVVLSRRSTFRILADLQKAGYISRTRTGRKNQYEVNRNLPLADPLVAGLLPGGRKAEPGHAA